MSTTNFVAGFLFRDRGCGAEVALIQKSKPAWQKGRLNGIGGKIETGEKPSEAMIREFQEETGATVEDWRPFCTLKGPDWAVEFFESWVPAEVATQEEEEVMWVLVSQIQTLPHVIDNLRWLIPMALDGERVVAVAIQS